nr:immunoglobulin heavy chain junction region [Macaca mulatta]
CTTNNWNTDYW